MEKSIPSILTSIKKLLGIAEEYQVYDADLIMHINSVFSILTQLGVGPADGFSIEDEDAVWTDFIPEKSKIEFIKSYMHMMQVYEDLDNHVAERGYDVRCFGYDPYNAKEFVERWASENGPFGIEKVIQGAKTESVPLGELKKLSEERMLLFDEELMSFCMGNCITITDTNGNRKLYKKRGDQKIDAVAAMMDAYIAYKLNRDAFE